MGEENVTYVKDGEYHGLRHSPVVVDYKNREQLVDFHFKSYLNKTQAMFKWNGLPDTIPERDLEMLIQTRGFGCFIEHEENYYVLFGHLGGRLNFDYMPSMATIANPYLEISGNWDIYYGYDKSLYDKSQNVLTDGKECVVIPNDPLYRGLTPILSVYANRMADTAISRRVVTIMSRAMNVFIAGDNNTYSSVKTFMTKLESGELDAITDNDFMKEIKSLPFGSSSSAARMITELIEAEQYDKASLYNELGLQANYNMKREAINSDEAQLGEDAILPLCDIMLEQRQLACKRINTLFGLNVSVDFSSAWKLTRESMESAIENDETEKEVEHDERNDSDSGIGDADGDGDGSSGDERQ